MPKQNIKLYIPDQKLPELDYVIHCLFKEFLGFSIPIVKKKGLQQFIIEGPIKKIHIPNLFFEENLPKRYTPSHIPNQVCKNQWQINGVSYPIVSLYGPAELKIGQDIIRLESDLFASTFFMLSRWEELAIKTRDQHQRFNARHSLAFRFNFLERPIVNEYIEILKALLRSIGFSESFKTYHYQVIPTHDVDSPYFWRNHQQKLKSVAKALLSFDFNQWKRHFRQILSGKDPFDTFDFLMDQSEEIGSLSHFFFITGGQSQFDQRYNINHPAIVKLIRHIQQRGHHVGLHPSYDAYNDKTRFVRQKKRLEKICKSPINTGRQHYLRFENPITWEIWSEAGCKWESTMTYARAAGFRCGICYPYPVFHILERKRLPLFEKPTIVMEASLLGYQQLSIDQAVAIIKRLKVQVKKYQGDFIFLWHNSSFFTPQYAGFEEVLYCLYGKK